MRRRSKPLLVAIAFVVLLWAWPAVPAGCPHGENCSAMQGGGVSCAQWRSDSGCCSFRAPVDQPASETALGGPAAASPFLLFAMVRPGSQIPGRCLAVNEQPYLLRALALPLYLLHASFLN